jgi:IPT/TIG domain-containing protein
MLITSVTREANTVKSNPAYVRLLKRFKFVSGFAMLLPWLLLPALAAGQVSSVQVNSSDAVFINRSTVAVPFTAAQTAGNLNVVVVGWSDTSSTIASVTDSNGNSYVLAATTESTAVPASGSPQLGVSQAIYYAKNIVAGTNTVTATFNQNTAVQSVRIVEYTGLDSAHPLDTSVSNTGSVLTADSGAVTTNSANDLLFGAGTITTAFTGSGAGFTTVLINGLGDIVEHKVVSAVGSYNATATLGFGSWAMQMVAFRAAGQTPPTFAAPTITSLSTPSSPEAGGIALTLTGANFEPGAAVIFSNTGGSTAAGVNCSVSATTTINCLTPSFPSGSATITVTNVDGQTSSPSAFTFTASTPFATATSPSMTPDTGSTNGATLVTISGSDFAAGAKVTVGGLPADRVAVVNVNTIQASVPANPAGLKTVVVTNPSGNNAALAGGYTYASGTTGINFVQVNSAQPASPATTATITYPLAQTAGNLNVVAIGWADITATVQSVVDSAGNTYTLAFTPTVGSGLSQAIYYAKNIVAKASNTVTVTFSAAAQSDVRILEYSGLDPVSPLDDTNGQSGTGTRLDSGTVFTTVAGDLVVGASMAVGKVITVGPTYTTVTTTPGGISVEHLIGPAAGRLGATAVQDSNANWVMQAVAFRQVGTVPDFGITVTPPTTATVAAGSPATYTISVSAINFSSVVTLSCSAGQPLGTSCAFVPPTVTPGATAVTSVLTITTTSATPAATSTVTVTGTAGSLSHNTTVGLTVTDFTIAAMPLSPASVVAGTPSASPVTISAVNGFTGTVNLSCSSIIPTGTGNPACTFVPASIAGGSGNSSLTVNTLVTTSPVAYTVTVTGTSGSLNHSAAPLALTVTAPPTPDFAIAASTPTPATVSAGASSTSTITIAPVNSFTSAVALTCSVAPPVTRGPGCVLNPASVTNGSGTSTLTVSTTAATTASLAPRSNGLLYAMLLPIGGLALLGTGFTSRKKKLCGFLLGCLLFSTLIILPACGGSGSSGGGGGGGHPGTPAGTYNITVTATAGSLTHTATVSVKVQ